MTHHIGGCVAPNTLIIPQTTGTEKAGSIFLSGSTLWYYDGTQYKQIETN